MRLKKLTDEYVKSVMGAARIYCKNTDCSDWMHMDRYGCGRYGGDNVKKCEGFNPYVVKPKSVKNTRNTSLAKIAKDYINDLRFDNYYDSNTAKLPKGIFMIRLEDRGDATRLVSLLKELGVTDCVIKDVREDLLGIHVYCRKGKK